MPEDDYEAAGELLRVLSAPIRLAIITRLAQGPATVSELTAEVGHSQPLVSQHLRILRSGRLVHAVTDGRERIYQLVDEHVAHIAADAIRHTSEPDHQGNVPTRTTSTTATPRSSGSPRSAAARGVPAPSTTTKGTP